MLRPTLRKALMMLLTVVWLVSGLAAQVAAETLYLAGTTGLYSFDTAAPTAFTRIPITGMRDGERVEALDIRPANGQLYGLTQIGNLYTIDTVTGAATLVRNIPVIMVISGFNTGFDFDPATDKLRVVNVTYLLSGPINNSFSINVDTGEVEVLPTLQGPYVSSIAHTNNYAGADLTTLYGTNGSILVSINPADGTVTTVAEIPQVRSIQPFGFDISGVTGTAYIVNNTLGDPFITRIFSVDLSTGQATLLGQIPRATLYNLAAPVGLPRRPFGGTPRLLPGRIEAEDYDEGGQGVAYHDTTAGNEGGVYRSDDVDLKETSDEGGGYAVGWFAAGEWLSYTVEVAEAGTYDLEIRVGSALPDRTFRIEVDGRDVTGAVPVPQTAAWDCYETVRVSGVGLAAGRQRLRVVMGELDYMDLNWISVVPSGVDVAPDAQVKTHLRSQYDN